MRPWETFLTDIDREHLKVWGKRAPFGLGERPAVLVVDDYYGALGSERAPILESIKTWPMSCGLEGWEAIDRTVELLAAARAANVPVIYCRSLEGFPSPWTRRPFGGAPTSDELRLSNEIVAEIAPAPDDLVVEKAAPSAFAGTPLRFHLTYLGIDTLLVCGETTSGCVRATVVDAATERLRVGVVEECCFDRTQAAHAMNLFDMDQKYADVMQLDAACAYLKERTGEQLAVLSAT